MTSPKLESKTLLDIGGGVVTVSAAYNPETQEIHGLYVTNGLTVGEKPTPLRVVLGAIDYDAPPGYSEWTPQGRKPGLPANLPQPHLEVHYSG
jgi:hypothetical protein